MVSISIHAYLPILVGARPRWRGLLSAIAQGLAWLILVMPQRRIYVNHSIAYNLRLVARRLAKSASR